MQPQVWPFCLLLVAAGLALAAPGLAGERYALLIAAGRYDSAEILPVKYAEKDVAALAEELPKVGYDKRHVLLLTTAMGEYRKQLAPTAANIRQQLKLSLLDVGRDDTLLVAFTGHGVQFAGDKEIYLCPAESRLADRKTLISLSALYEMLSDSKLSASRKKVLLLDISHGDPRTDTEKQASKVELEPAGLKEWPEAPVGVTTLFSCSARERSLADEQLRHSVFMYYALLGFSYFGDLDKDGRISLAELEQYLTEKVPRRAKDALRQQQTPQRSGEKRKSVVVGVIPEDELFSKEPPRYSKRAFNPFEVGWQRDDNGLKMKFVWCPPGNFSMGSPKAEQDRKSNEGLVKVSFSRGFWLGKYEVSHAHFRGQNYKEALLQPAIGVSYEDALKFCQKFTAAERTAGRLEDDEEYNLPTEAQWEYACRAGTTTRYSFGEDEEQLPDHAWFNDTSDYPAPRNVGGKRPNPWDLYDMHGNACEWCRDCYTEKLPGGIDPLVAKPEEYRVLRGGAISTSALDCRSARREFAIPGLSKGYIGFRVARVSTK